MFDTIDHVTKANDATITGANIPVKPSSASQTTAKPDQPKKQAEAAEKGRQEISQEFLGELEHDIQMIHNVGLQFSVHESTGRTMVRVVNKDTGNMIREIPPKEILDLAAKLDEMIGILFDKKI